MATVQLPPAWAAQWQLDRKLGSGGFSTVWRAVRRDQPTVEAAIKIIAIPADDSELEELISMRLDASRSQSYYDSLARQYVSEIIVMENLKGRRNIVNIEDYCVVRKPGRIGNLIYIRMELLTPLSGVLKSRFLSEGETLRLGIDVCTALGVCHAQNILHRDIKPANIFISSRTQNGVFYKLGDFGVARSTQAMSHGLSIKGTPGYMAPEVLLGREYDTRADLYSLGITLYLLLNRNRYPFMGERVSAEGKEQAISRRINGDRLPPPVDASGPMAQVILKACAYNPEDRFQTAAEMRDALLRVLNGESRPVREVQIISEVEEPTPRRRQENTPRRAAPPEGGKGGNRWRAWVLGICLAAMVAAAGVIGISLTGQHQRAARQSTSGGESAYGMAAGTAGEAAEKDLPTEDPLRMTEEPDSVRTAASGDAETPTPAMTSANISVPTQEAISTPIWTLTPRDTYILIPTETLTVTPTLARLETNTPALNTVITDPPEIRATATGQPLTVLPQNQTEAPTAEPMEQPTAEPVVNQAAKRPAELPAFRLADMSREQKYSVYSAPGSKSLRGANGKAIVSTNGEVYISGRTENWMLICYEKNAGSIRIGYIEISKIKGSVPSVPWLSFGSEQVGVARTCGLTDDPVNVSETLCTVSAGTRVTWLAMYGDWAYIETTTGGKTVRGFIPEDCIDN